MLLKKEELEKEREQAISFGIVLDTYSAKSLEIIDKLNPLKNLPAEVTGIGKTPQNEMFTGQKGMVQDAMAVWLQMFDDTLKAGRLLPVDLIGRAADLARRMREDEQRTETHPTQ